MADDNLTLDADGNAPLAVLGTIEASFSGDTVDIGLAALVTSSGAENSRVAALVDTSNPLPVSDAGGTLTVDAPVATPVFVRLSDGASAITTLPVSLASAPSTAVTNAGTFATQVDGAALTALQLIDNLPNTQGSTTSGQSGVLAQGAVTTAAPSYTTAQTSPLSLDTAGSLRVAIMSGAGSGGTAMTDDAAFTAGTTSVTPIAAMFDNVSVDSVDENDAGIVRMSANRNLFVNIRDNAGNERGLNIDASGQLAVTVASAQTLATVTTVGTVTTLTGTTTLTPGTGATNLGKAVDTAVGATDTGVAALYQRVDSPAAITPVVNDYARGIVDSMGRQWAQTGGGMATGTMANVAAAVSSTTLIASNAARKGFVIHNDTVIQGNTLYIHGLGGTASATAWTWKLEPGESLERIGPCITGLLTGIWVSAAGGTARTTEFT